MLEERFSYNSYINCYRSASSNNYLEAGKKMLNIELSVFYLEVFPLYMRLYIEHAMLCISENLLSSYHKKNN